MFNLFKGLIIIVVMLSFVSCGKQTQEVTGNPGKDGESCYAESVDDGVNVICGDKTSFIPNGKDGNDGVDGVDGTDGQDGVDGEDGDDGSFEGYLDYVEVCEDVPGKYKETLLHLDGKYMAFLSSSNYKKQRLVLLEEGVMYRTTDGRNVSFSIINGEITCLN